MRINSSSAGPAGAKTLGPNAIPKINASKRPLQSARITASY